MRPVPTVVAEPIVVVESAAIAAPAATTEPASESQPPQAAEVLAGLREATVESATVAVAKEPVVAVDPAVPSVPTAAPASIALPTEPSLPLTQEVHSRRKIVAAWVFGTVVGLLTLFGTVTTFATFLITKSLGN